MTTSDESAAINARIIDLRAQGVRDAEIGCILGLSHQAVRSRVRSMRQRGVEVVPSQTGRPSEDHGAEENAIEWTPGPSRYARMLHRMGSYPGYIAEELRQQFPAWSGTPADVVAHLTGAQ